MERDPDNSLVHMEEKLFPQSFGLAGNSLGQKVLPVVTGKGGQ